MAKRDSFTFILQCFTNYTVSVKSMIGLFVTNGKVLKEAVVAYFKVLFHPSPGATNETEKLTSVWIARLGTDF
jgi:hypothetical protein